MDSGNRCLVVGSENDQDENVARLATEFRSAVMNALPLNDAVMDSFPNGTCGDASILLGQYLFDKGLGEWMYRSGDRNTHSHAWIEQEGLRVDVTADQFDDIDEEVIVTRDATWHSEFTPIAGNGQKAFIDIYDDATKRRLRSLYQRIVPAPEET